MEEREEAEAVGVMEGVVNVPLEHPRYTGDEADVECDVSIGNQEAALMKCEYPFFIERKKGFISRSTYQHMPDDLKKDLIPHPCGRCFQCRLLRAKIWTTRCIMEAAHHPINAFVTLTYDDEFLPQAGSLQQKDLTKFLKRLRKREEPNKFRYFGVGEYGTDGDREYNPHYHLILFNYSYFNRPKLEASWAQDGKRMGFISIGEVTPASIRYVTEYCIKKWDKDNGTRPQKIAPEFMASSKQNTGGIGTVAIEEIAANLRAPYDLKPDEYYPGEPPTKIRFQNKTWPIDYYMRRKLYDKLKLDPEVQKKFLCSYTDKMFDEHSKEIGIIDLTKTVEIKNKEVSQIWTRKYKKRIKKRKL